MMQQVRDYAMLIVDPNGHILMWNQGAAQMTGYSQEEIIGKRLDVLHTLEDIQQEHMTEVFEKANREGRVFEEGWRARKDGSRFWASVLTTALRDDRGNPIGYGKIIRDLSEKREAEDTQRELSGRLLKFQDVERRRIARELHDTTSPLLTSLITRLYKAKQKANESTGDLAAILSETIAVAEATNSMVRTMASLIHPPMLDEEGLIPSLRWYVDAFANRTGVRVNADLPAESKRPPRDMEVALFRIAQEWMIRLTEAGSSTIAVRARDVSSALELQLEARGSHWPTEWRRSLEDARDALGVTILAERERLRQLGGALTIQASAERTTVIATVPSQG